MLLAWLFFWDINGCLRAMLLCRSLAFSKGKSIASELKTDYYLEPEKIVTAKYLQSGLGLIQTQWLMDSIVHNT